MRELALKDIEALAVGAWILGVGAHRFRVPFNVAGRTNMSGSISPWPVVKSGSNGHPIKTLQYLLRARGQSVAVDGVFGPNAAACGEAFQTSHGLTADGIVGPVTCCAALSISALRAATVASAMANARV